MNKLFNSILGLGLATLTSCSSPENMEGVKPDQQQPIATETRKIGDLIEDAPNSLTETHRVEALIREFRTSNKTEIDQALQGCTSVKAFEVDSTTELGNVYILHNPKAKEGEKLTCGYESGVVKVPNSDGTLRSVGVVGGIEPRLSETQIPIPQNIGQYNFRIAGAETYPQGVSVLNNKQTNKLLKRKE